MDMLHERIRSLEALTEGLTSELNTVREELLRVRSERDNFLERLFKLSGIDKTDSPKVDNIPQQINRAAVPWAIQKAKLEQQSRDNYWRNKEAEANKVKDLEKEVGIEVKNEETGS